MALPLFLAWHKHRLTTHPYLFNSAQSAVLMTVGDSVAQALERDGRVSRGEEDTGYDAARLLVLTSWACGVNAPFWTWWYRALNKHWQGGKVVGWVLASAALSPLWNGAFFCYTTSLTHAIKAQEGSLVVKLEERISTQLVPTVIKSCCLWIPFNFVRVAAAPCCTACSSSSAPHLPAALLPHTFHPNTYTAQL